MKIKKELNAIKFERANSDLSFWLKKRKNEVLLKTGKKYTKQFDKDVVRAIRLQLLREGHYLAAWQILSCLAHSFDNTIYGMRFSRSALVFQNLYEDNYKGAVEYVDAMLKVLPSSHPYYESLKLFKYEFLGCAYEPTKSVIDNPYYGELFTGKKVAFVGPAQDEEIDYDIIGEEYDTLVVLNYAKDLRKVYKRKNDIKIVSYYNYSKFCKIRDDTYPENEIFSQPDGVVAKFAVDSINTLLFNQSRKKYRNMQLLQAFEYFGDFNMVQDVLFDIISFRPDKLKVFGVNLYLESRDKLYDKEYFRDDVKGDYFTALIEAFLQHCPDVNYEFLRLLYKNNKYEPDRQLKRILDMGVEKYLLEMEKLY